VIFVKKKIFVVIIVLIGIVGLTNESMANPISFDLISYQCAAIFDSQSKISLNFNFEVKTTKTPMESLTETLNSPFSVNNFSFSFEIEKLLKRYKSNTMAFGYFF
jgi:hypothetical protein